MSIKKSQNVDLKRMFSSNSGTDGFEIHNHNLSNEQYQAELARFKDLIHNKFKQIENKNPNDTMSKDEILRFLDKCSTNGKPFDRGIAEKILNVLDESGNIVTINEFTTTYIQIIEELKLNTGDVQRDLRVEEANLEKYTKLANDNRNEILNQQGINENKAKFYVTIDSLAFTDPNEMKPGVSIVMMLGDETQQTRKQNSGYEWGDRFEFNVKKKDYVIYELRSLDYKLGEIRFHLSAVETQEEYEVELEVINDSTKSVIAKIKCKIQFVWSLYKLYQDSATKSEKRIGKFKTTIAKSNRIIDELNGPFNFFQGGSVSLSADFDSSGASVGASILFDPGLSKLFKKVMPVEKQLPLADKIEDLLKKNLKKESLNFTQLITQVCVGIIILALFSAFSFASFVDIIVIGYILLITFTTITSNTAGYLSQFFSITAILIVYDLFWLLFASTTGSVYDGGVENFLKGTVFLLKLISFLLKIGLIVVIWIYSLKQEKDTNNRSQYNDSSVNANLN